MKYDGNRKWVRAILDTANVMNTINGGMSQPQIRLARKDDHYLIKAWVPGTSSDALNVEIIDNTLLIYHNMDFSKPGKEKRVIPHLIATYPLTPDVDYKNITAREIDGELMIKMPFNELSSGYRQVINVDR